VRRGMLGVTIQGIDADLASSLELPAARGALVTSVTAGGPADRNGIERGDVITAINNQSVADNNMTRNAIAKLAPASTATVTIVRNGREQNVQATLAELPDRQRPDSEDNSGQESSSGGTERFGLTLQPLTSSAAPRYGLDADDQGLLVTRVDPSSDAASAGVREGDLIQEVNRQPVKTFVDFSNALRQSGSRPALVLLKRRNNVIYLTLKANS